MNEKEMNRAIAKTFNDFAPMPQKDPYGRDCEPLIPSFGYKIPDPSWPGAKGQKRPFDGFAVHLGFTIFWEAKFQRGYRTFSWSRLQQHQFNALKRVWHPKAGRLALMILGVNEPGRGTDLFFVDFKMVWHYMEWCQVKSLPADVIAGWKRQGLYRPLKKGKFSLENFPDFIITT